MFEFNLVLFLHIQRRMCFYNKIINFAFLVILEEINAAQGNGNEKSTGYSQLWVNKCLSYKIFEQLSRNQI